MEEVTPLTFLRPVQNLNACRTPMEKFGLPNLLIQSESSTVRGNKSTSLMLDYIYSLGQT